MGYRLGVRLPDRPDERGGRLPIYLAALRPRMLELAGEIGDGLVVNLFPVTALPRMLDAVRTGAERAGRDLDGYEVVCRFQVGITDDRAATREIVRQIFTGYAAAPVYNKFFAWCGFEDVAENVAKAWAARDREGSRKALTDDFVDRITILGSAEECRDQLAEFVAAGVTTPIIQPLALGREASEAVLRTFAPAR